MTPDEQIAVIAAERDGKKISKQWKNYVGWMDKSPDEEFDFERCEYRIRPEPPKPREWFVNEYRESTSFESLHETREEADKNAGWTRIRCVRLVEDLSYDGSVGKE